MKFKFPSKPLGVRVQSYTVHVVHDMAVNRNPDFLAGREFNLNPEPLYVARIFEQAKCPEAALCVAYRLTQDKEYPWYKARQNRMHIVRGSRSTGIGDYMLVDDVGWYRLGRFGFEKAHTDIAQSLTLWHREKEWLSNAQYSSEYPRV